jgi:phenylpropionate dioxygenase-like ring-hydroxylating dioxygenase large terminal subunit
MRTSDARPVIETLLERLAARQPWRDEASTVPAGVYTDPAHLQAERAALFRGLPQVVALSPDLPEAGSVLARDLDGLPLVLTRDHDGEVHALANVCAHRAARVVTDGRSCQRRLTCPYHAWSYDLAGTLRGVPDAASFPTVEVPGPGLRRLPVVEDHGLVWVLADVHAGTAAGRPAPLAAPPLGAIGDDLDHYDLAAHHHWRSHRFDLAFNWKLVVDTFLEPYHLGILHRDTVGPYFVTNLCVVHAEGPHLREVLARRSLTGLADQDPASWDLRPHSTIVYVLFPNMVLVHQMDRIETWRVQPHPADPGRSTCELDFYLPRGEPTPSSERYWERNWCLTVDTVNDEDFSAMAGVQQGLASGALDEVHVGANEPAFSRYHRALDSVVPYRR